MKAISNAARKALKKPDTLNPEITLAVIKTAMAEMIQ